MPRFSLRASSIQRIFLPLLLGLAALSAGRGSPRAAEAPVVTHAYLVPSDEGYGLTECLAEGGDCARIVADAWCEAHGHAHAVAVGRAEDVTGAITPVKTAAPAEQAAPKPGEYVVSCGE